MQSDLDRLFDAPEAPITRREISDDDLDCVPTPPVSKLYVPYRYVVDRDNGIFRICTRSTDGESRKTFSLQVSPWCYVEIPEVVRESEIDRTIDILRSEMATDRVSYSEEASAFIVEPAKAVNRRVRDVSQNVIEVDTQTYSVLSRFGQKFYDPLHVDGHWASSDQLASSPIDIALTTPFRTVILCGVDSNSIAYVRRGFSSSDSTTVYIFTTHSGFSGHGHIDTACKNVTAECVRYFGKDKPASEENDPPEFNVKVRSFSTVAALRHDVSTFIKSETDIAVFYGQDDAGTNLIDTVVKDSRSNISKETVEIFDMRDYVENVYPDMPSHEFIQVGGEIDLVSTDTTTMSPMSDSDAIAAGASVIYLNRTHSGSLDGPITSISNPHHVGPYIPDMKANAHSTENIVFCMERIASRAHLLGKLFDNLRNGMFEFANVSGCNLSDLTKPGHASRGIVSFINPSAAHSDCVDTLPQDRMESGLHTLTYVTPMSSLLIENMIDSGHTLTETVGRNIETLKIFGWTVREIYSMRGLAPRSFAVPPTTFGIFRGMIYSNERVRGHESTRQWSSILNVGLGSWIGVTMAYSPTEKSGPITFGYFGIEDACRHPFDAIRLAVEMSLSFQIMNKSPASPKTIASSVSLTNDTMEMRQRVTSANIDTYRALIPPEEIGPIESGEIEKVISVWYRSNGNLTTNSILADRRFYTNLIEMILVKSFSELAAAIERRQSVEPEEIREPTPEPIHIPQKEETSPKPPSPTEVVARGKDRIFPRFSFR